MLSPEEARKELEKLGLSDEVVADRMRRRFGLLPGRPSKVARSLLRDTPSAGHSWAEEVEKSGNLVDEMTEGERRTLFEAFSPQAAAYLDGAWEILKRTPHQFNPYNPCRRPFRAPRHPHLTALSRAIWLQPTSQIFGRFDQDIEWFAAWAGHMPAYQTHLGFVFAAAIDAGGEEGEEVFSILRASASGDHEIGRMGRHIIRAFLTCSRPEAWEYMEKMLLAAQREEGLRQAILETIDEAHPEAFRRMLKLILEQNLVRFSSVVRSADVWFGLLWDSASAGKIREILERAAHLLDDEEARKEALRADDPEEVYLALWCIGFEDVLAAMDEAERILKHPNPGHRFVAVYFLRQTAVSTAPAYLIPGVEDEDLRVAATAVETFIGRDRDELAQTDLFERLERSAPRFPKRQKKLEALVWPWMEFTAAQGRAVTAMIWNRGKRDPLRMAPFLSSMDPWNRRLLVEILAKVRDTNPQARAAILERLGDTSRTVRDQAFEALKDYRPRQIESPDLEKLLTRKPPDLRKGIIAILLNQGDHDALASADRLIASADERQRMAGLEILRQMTGNGRSVEACRKRGERHEASETEVSTGEIRQVEFLVAGEREEYSLDDGLGLFDPAKRTRPVPPQKKSPRLTSDAAAYCIESLDELIHQHRDRPFKIDHWGQGQEMTLGTVKYGFPNPSRWGIPEREPDLPLEEIWKEWLENRTDGMRDEDGLELVRARCALEAAEARTRWTDIEDRDAGRRMEKAYAKRFPREKTPRIRYPHLLQALFEWFLKLEPVLGTPRFLMDLAETGFSRNSPEDLKERPPKENRISTGAGRFFSFSNQDNPRERIKGSTWYQFALRHWRSYPETWSDGAVGRLWRLARWWDEPVFERSGFGALSKAWRRIKKTVGTEDEWFRTRLDAATGKELIEVEIYRDRPPFSLVVAAWRLGAAVDADVYEQILGPRGSRPGYYTRRSWDELGKLTRRKPGKEYATDERLRRMADRCRERVLEVELQRGEGAAVTSGPAICLSRVEGAGYLVRILSALGKGKLVRGYDYLGSEGYENVFSHLIRVSYPAADDTAGGFAELVKKSRIPERRLVELAVYAPQWSAFVEKSLGWDGLEDGVWWIHAHTKDTQWSVSDEIREDWAARVTERTPLSAQDLLDGAVDVAWFHRAHEKLESDRWEKVHKAAKFASSAGGHSRARLFADAMLGSLSREEMETRVREKRHQDTVRAVGLLPLPEGDAAKKEVLSRYEFIQEFVRGSKKFGSQRQASEKLAAEIGLQNLARTAGYPDPIRLQWAMESEALADLKDGRVTIEKDGVKVSLVIDDLGAAGIEIEKNGKPRKTVPAKIKKDPEIKALTSRKADLRKQLSRIRMSLEQMMCRGDAIRADELSDLSAHPLLFPILRGLVFVNESGDMGYPSEDCRSLLDYADREHPIGKELRVAHAHDLLQSGEWHEWQRDCFARERVQPFKQVFRELYVLTETESEDKKISRRYAGHQVQPRQALALLGGRGWVNDREVGVRKTFYDLGLSSWLGFMEPFYTPAEVEGLTLEGVFFSKRGEWEPLSLDDIPPRMFSEVMRDVDLVVSVAHRGGVDPEASASTVEMRAALLRETLASLEIGNVEVKERRACIKGDLGEYTVHLGSAVCHKIPGGHLLIVPVHAQHRGRIFLPFADDDPKTAEVLSKVLLLARDRKIKDPSILDQIG